ncbi:MAG: hypothetical protein WBF99_01255 [Xanthobacteraceae bacterium]
MAVVPIPSRHRLARWLDNEALRIAAGVRNASIENTVGTIYRASIVRGCDEGAAGVDARQARAYIVARIEQIEDMLSSPPPYNYREVGNG